MAVGKGATVVKVTGLPQGSELTRGGSTSDEDFRRGNRPYRRLKLSRVHRPEGEGRPRAPTRKALTELPPRTGLAKNPPRIGTSRGTLGLEPLRGGSLSSWIRVAVIAESRSPTVIETAPS
jgi:hypothetical protein